MAKKRELKIALVNPPLLPGMFRHHPLVPLGLAYLAAVLEEADYEVKVFDCPPLGITHKNLEGLLADFSPDFVGITCMSMIYPSALEAAAISKKCCPDALVAIGGPHATFYDVEILTESPHIDVVVRGEGEKTVVEMANCLAEGEKIQKIHGITLRKQKEIVRTPDRELIQNLNELPYPAYHLFPIDNYRVFGKKILPIMTSRGCPFQCSFCVTSRMVGKKFRARSPENVTAELKWLVSEHNADAFCFYDDTLTLDKKRIFDICEMIKKEKIGVPWDCQTRADQVSNEVLSKMVEAGCQLVSFGAESGSQKILGSIGKGTTVEQNLKAIRLAKEAGLLVAISIVLGYPGETVETLRETVDFIWKAKPDDAYLCFATPYPGTELQKLINSLGWTVSKDWTKYDTLNPVVENPNLPNEYLLQLRRDFYNEFYSPSYIIKHFFRRGFYSRMMARTAFNHLLWRIKGAQ